MEKYPMNYPGRRPYNRTCGMTNSSRPACMQPQEESRRCPCRQEEKNCSCRMPGAVSKDAEMYSHLQHLVPAMAYVPCQNFTSAFDFDYALSVGTLFPELCKPFCGKRGVFR